MGNKIYIIGGSNSFATPLSTVYCYSPDGDSINARASLPTATMDQACGVWRDSLIYVMGGGNWVMAPISNVQIYDIANDTWSAGTSMPAAIGVLGGAVCGDTIVTACGDLGGGTWTDAVYVGAIDPANPASISWSAGTAYPGGVRARPSTMAYDGKLFVTAGWTGSVMSPATYAYTPTTDIWEPLPDKTTATVSAGQAAKVGRWAYVVSGEAGPENEALYLGTLTGVEGKPTELAKPAIFALLPNFPNPVRSRTTLSFNLPKAGEYSLKVYNIAGQMVDRIGGRGQAGPNSVSWNASKSGAGVYFYRLSSGGQSATGKLVVVK